MPYISTIIARVLALTDWFLAQWVSAVPSPVTGAGNCYSAYTINATVNACGQNFLTNVTDIIEGVTALVPLVLAGLFATG
jgi:hypothetical protein